MKTDTQRTPFGLYFSPEAPLQQWSPEQDPNDYKHLANLLLSRWTPHKGSCLVVNGESKPELASTLKDSFDSFETRKKLNSVDPVHPNYYDLICLLFESEKSYFSIYKATKALKGTGTLFLRTLRDELYTPDTAPEGISQIFSKYGVAREISLLNNDMRQMAGDTGEYYIHEVYDIGNFRDYLIKYRPEKKTICAGLIVKNEERDLPKLLESLGGSVDALCLYDTGSTDDTIKKFQNINVSSRDGGIANKYYKTYLDASTQVNGEWKLWDFSKARNQYVQMIEDLGYDYVLWMDADDELMNPELVSLLPLFDQYTVHGLTMDTGNSAWIHHRMWKTKNGIKYQGRCHEYPTIGGHSVMLHKEIVVKHDATPIAGMEDSNDRNLRILLKAAEEEPTSRIHFYLANTYKDRGDHENAVKWYTKRIEDGHHYFDEYLFAILYKARCQRALKDFSGAEETLLKGYHLSKWAEFSMELCYMYYGESRFMEAIEWAHYAIRDWKHQPPETALWREHNKYTDQPYRFLSWSYHLLKKTEMAYLYGTKVKNFVKDESWEKFVQSFSRTPWDGKIKFVRPGAIGDILMCATVLQQFHKENPDTLIYFAVHPSLKPLVEPLLVLAGATVVAGTDEPEDSPFYRKVVNLIGYPRAEGYPDKPMQKHLLEYFAKEMGVKGEVGQLSLPLQPKAREGDYATIHPQALWSPYKNWDLKNWEEVIQKLDLPVVQFGAKEDKVLTSVAQSYLGYGFNTALNLLSHAKFHMGVDSWSNHGTNILWEGKAVKGFILWGSTQMEAAGYKKNVNITHKVPCQPCFKEDPKISAESRGYCMNMHACMTGITVEKVLEKIKHEVL